MRGQVITEAYVLTCVVGRPGPALRLPLLSDCDSKLDASYFLLCLQSEIVNREHMKVCYCFTY